MALDKNNYSLLLLYIKCTYQCYISFFSRVIFTLCDNTITLQYIVGIIYYVVIVLSVLRFTAFDYTFGILWSLCCLFFDIQILITPLVSSNSSYFTPRYPVLER